MATPGAGVVGDGREPEADGIALGMFVDSLRACSDPTKRRAADVIADLCKRLSETQARDGEPRPCCGEYSTCGRPCTPRGEQLALRRGDAYAMDMRALLEEADCPNGMCDKAGTVTYYQKGQRVPEPCPWCAKRDAALAKNPNPSGDEGECGESARLEPEGAGCVLTVAHDPTPEDLVDLHQNSSLPVQEKP